MNDVTEKELEETKAILKRVKSNCAFLSAESDRLLDIIETLFHFKGAYSRALNYVCKEHFQNIPAKDGDDQFFVVDGQNCCATDILIAEMEKQRV